MYLNDGGTNVKQNRTPKKKEHRASSKDDTSRMSFSNNKRNSDVVTMREFWRILIYEEHVCVFRDVLFERRILWRIARKNGKFQGYWIGV